MGLLNILEERDVQVRGHNLRLPLDLFFVASANPEDYTSRGRIITPLKDRLGSQIRTHYPRTIDHELRIMAQERTRFDDTDLVMDEPDFMLEIVAELSHLARRASEVSQRSGVSVRVSISNLETLLANAVRRAVRLGETSAAPRMSDLGALIPSTIGKLELESLSDEIPEERVVDRLLARGHPRRLRTTRGDRTRCPRSWMRSRQGWSSGPASRCRPGTMSAGCARRPACPRQSAVWAWASRLPRSPRVSSSCWRGCISTGG